jgi:hypothetical protein
MQDKQQTLYHIVLNWQLERRTREGMELASTYDLCMLQMFYLLSSSGA